MSTGGDVRVVTHDGVTHAHRYGDDSCSHVLCGVMFCRVQYSSVPAPVTWRSYTAWPGMCGWDICKAYTVHNSDPAQVNCMACIALEKVRYP